MKRLHNLIETIQSLPTCHMYESSTLPVINESKHILPDDVKEFYRICGGLTLFEEEEYAVQLVSPEEFVLANPVIVGELCEEDISSNWYIIGKENQGEYITIDFHDRCYDSFFDRPGVIGESQIIATLFTYLLESLVKSKGEELYWLKDGFKSFGDAYDDRE